MSIGYLLAAAVPLAPVFVYMFFIARRLARLLLPGLSPGRLRAAGLVGAAALVLPAADLVGLWTLILLHFTALCALADCARLVVKRIKKPSVLSKRSQYLFLALPAALTALVMLLGALNMRDVRRTDYAVSTEKQIRAGGYAIALITDLHYGVSMDSERLSEICGEISALEPDVVLLGGDIVDENTTAGGMRECFAALGGISSEYGVFCVFGNHDRAQYSSAPNFTERQLADAIESAGITALEDETLELAEELTLTGRRDRSQSGGARASSAELLKSPDDGRYHIILDHQPVELSKNAAAGFDLMLSGHTHGGQIWPIGLIERLAADDSMVYGLERVGSMTAITSSGMAGWGYPIRTEGRCEYVIVTLRGAQSAA